MLLLPVGLACVGALVLAVYRGPSRELVEVVKEKTQTLVQVRHGVLVNLARHAERDREELASLCWSGGRGSEHNGNGEDGKGSEFDRNAGYVSLAIIGFNRIRSD